MYIMFKYLYPQSRTFSGTELSRKTVTPTQKVDRDDVSELHK